MADHIPYLLVPLLTLVGCHWTVPLMYIRKQRGSIFQQHLTRHVLMWYKKNIYISQCHVNPPPSICNSFKVSFLEG